MVSGTWIKTVSKLLRVSGTGVKFVTINGSGIVLK